MPRSPRIEYPGARYHVLSRGNRRERVLDESEDKRLFLETLGEGCEKTGWLIHAYIFMDNHFHLLLETPEPNLSVGMRWVQGTYGNRYNRRHGLVGHVWQGRFKSPLISDEGDEYFRMVSRYIHLNPARAGLLPQRSPSLGAYRWSSFPALCGSPSKRPAWLVAGATLRAYDLRGDDAASRRKYRSEMELACRECLRDELTEEEEEAWRVLRRGWYVGEPTFRDRILDSLEEAVKGRKKHSLSGEGKRSHDEASARRLVRTCCNHLKMTPAQLRGRKYSNWEKQMVTAMLRARTPVTYDWIVEEIGMGSRASVYRAIRAVRDERGRARKAAWKTLTEWINSYH